eukprot:TRINITY_DN89527_c6_g1_i1.p1 TRINITY_DN89527_c6_g1~~TRINITY_DN89527_c6_g1_i1.p1  ORF type:complete len:121 (-),score=7.64 TRINITY_DN89527_c6_g1_i1:91-453(-)
MLIPREDRLKLYSFLFAEGVLSAKKDVVSPKHSDALPIQNLYVLKAMQSLKSRGYVRETFAWMHHYYFLTEEGVEYLRKFLMLPEDVSPKTHKKVVRAARPEGRRGGYRKGGDRPNFRKE